MDLLILDRQNNILDRFSNKFFSKLKYTELLNWIWKGSFEMSIENWNIKYDYLKSNNRLIFIDNNNKILFSGVLYEIIPTFVKNTYYFQNLIWIFNDKLLYSDTTYTTQSIDFILNDILSTVNAREDTYITLDCWITDTVTKPYKKLDTIYSMIEDLLLNKYEFTVKAKLTWITASFELVVKDTIWIDRTLVDNNYIQYKYDLDDWAKRNINQIEWDLDIRNTGNAIIWNEGASYEEQQDNTSITAIWRIERKFRTSWDLVWETTAYLLERKDIINSIDIVPLENNYLKVDIWDKVRIITSWNKYLELDTWIKVIWKTYELWDLIKVWLKLSNTKLKRVNFIDEINKLITKNK